MATTPNTPLMLNVNLSITNLNVYKLMIVLKPHLERKYLLLQSLRIIVQLQLTKKQKRFNFSVDVCSIVNYFVTFPRNT